MASFELIHERLLSALEMGLLEADALYIPALSDTVNTGRLILHYLTEAGNEGMTALELSRQSGLNRNTCLGYLRWLHMNSLVTRTRSVEEGNRVTWVIKRE